MTIEKPTSEKTITIKKNICCPNIQSINISKKKSSTSNFLFNVTHTYNGPTSQLNNFF